MPESAAGYLALQELPDGPMKTAVLSAFADSLGTCWIIACAMFIACLLVRRLEGAVVVVASGLAVLTTVDVVDKVVLPQ